MSQKNINNDNIDLIAEQAFQIADKDNSGAIDSDELSTVIKTICEHLDINMPSQDQINELLEQYDDNGDGELQFEEYKYFVQDLFFPQEQSIMESEVEEDMHAGERKSAPRKQRNSIFIKQIQKKQLQNQDSGLLNVLLTSEKQKIVSEQLKQMQEQLQKDLDQLINKKNPVSRFKRQIKEDQFNHQKFQRQSSFDDYKQQIQADQKYRDECKIQNNSCVLSVYTFIQPQTQNQSQQEDIYNKKNTKGIFNKNKQNKKTVIDITKKQELDCKSRQDSSQFQQKSVRNSDLTSNNNNADDDKHANKGDVDFQNFDILQQLKEFQKQKQIIKSKTIMVTESNKKQKKQF